MFEIWEQPKEDICLLLDIGNGSVGGTFVRFKHGAKPELIYTVRHPLHIPEKPNSTHLFSKMTKIFEEMLHDLSHNGIKHMSKMKLTVRDVKHVFCIFSSPWYAAKSKTLRVEKHHPVPVTEELIKKLLAAERQNIMAKAPENSIEFIEQKVIKIKLNGFETNNPYNQVARTLELSVFMSMVPNAVLTKVEKLISKYFNSRYLAFHSFALMSYNTIEDLFHTEDDYIFMDITGEVTELTVVSKGMITDTLSFPEGRNYLIRQISKRYKVSLDVAASYIKIFQKGTAHSALKKGIEKIIEETKRHWLQYFTKVLSEIGKKAEIPRKMFITIDDDVAPIFSGFLSGESLTVGTRHVVPDVTVLNKNILAHFCRFDHSSPPDTFLAIESMYFDKIFHL